MIYVFVTVDSESQVSSASKRIRRANTLEEKRRMRIARKKKQRRRYATNASELRHQIAEREIQLDDCEKRCVTYRCMSKTYWERWRYELEERKDDLMKERQFRFNVTHCVKSPGFMSTPSPTLPIIDHSMLTDPIQCESDKDIFVGRGSFGIIKFQQYRGIQVAVKEFLPRTRAESVRYEASILLKLSHPYVPLLLGICTSEYPFIIVMQYHGIDGRCVTLQKELIQKQILPSGSYHSWLVMISELAEAIRYLHEDVNIIHNDIKADNVVLSNSFTHQVLHSKLNFQIVLVDFGKATMKDKGHLGFHEREQYRIRYHHLAPEVIDGTMKQCVVSDVYSLGKLFGRIVQSACLVGLQSDSLERVNHLVKSCTSLKKNERPTARKICDVFEQLLKKLV